MSRVLIILSIISLFKCFSKECDAFFISQEVGLNSEVKIKLRNFLEDLKNRRSSILPLTRGARKVGSTIHFKKNRYKIISILGSGSEGVMYLVEQGGKRFTIKEIHKDHIYKTMLFAVTPINLKLFQKEGYKIVKIIDSDPQNFLFLMDYIEGVPLRALLEQGEWFGFTKAEMKLFNEVWDKYEKIDKNKHGRVKIHKRNAIIEIDTGQLIIIDPH